MPYNKRNVLLLSYVTLDLNNQLNYHYNFHDNDLIPLRLHCPGIRTAVRSELGIQIALGLSVYFGCYSAYITVTNGALSAVNKCTYIRHSVFKLRYHCSHF
jgi:hypothetical protein